MKYIDSEKLIELVKEWRSKQMGFAWDAVNEVLKIITSLQQEQPEVDIDREIEEYLDDFIKTPTRDYFRNAIIHFYDLGRNARKDALLEWAKEKHADLTKKLEAQDDPVLWGQRNAFQQVIDKLNSM